MDSKANSGLREVGFAVAILTMEKRTYSQAFTLTLAMSIASSTHSLMNDGHCALCMCAGRRAYSNNIHSISIHEHIIINAILKCIEFNILFIAENSSSHCFLHSTHTYHACLATAQRSHTNAHKYTLLVNTSTWLQHKFAKRICRELKNDVIFFLLERESISECMRENEDNLRRILDSFILYK